MPQPSHMCLGRTIVIRSRPRRWGCADVISGVAVATKRRVTLGPSKVKVRASAEGSPATLKTRLGGGAREPRSCVGPGSARGRGRPCGGSYGNASGVADPVAASKRLPDPHGAPDGCVGDATARSPFCRSLCR